jgi:hypothetical protein
MNVAEEPSAQRAPQAAEWTARLQHALVRALLAEYQQLNQTFFAGLLRTPAIELVGAQVRLGQWNADTRTISLSRSLLLQHGWGAVVEVLKHEMAHQYVADVVGERTESAHGHGFRTVCERLGIDPTASGIAVGRPQTETRVIERVARLLALAQSSNRHEAEAAMAAAQKLMLKYNMDACATRTDRSYGFRHLGTPSGRINEHERVLAIILNKHFFVEVIWVPVYRPLEAKSGSVLEVCGTPENLEMADYVYSFLVHTADRLWDEHKRANALGANRDRRVYLAGVMSGFLEKLDQHSRHHRQAGLVWVKDGKLNGYYRKRHPYIRNARYFGRRRTEAYDHGKQAGRGIVLHRAVQSACASAAGARPPSLPAKSHAT